MNGLIYFHDGQNVLRKVFFFKAGNSIWSVTQDMYRNNWKISQDIENFKN